MPNQWLFRGPYDVLAEPLGDQSGLIKITDTQLQC